MKYIWIIVIFTYAFTGCQQPSKKETAPVNNTAFVQILGVAQDAGYPQAGCKKSCCEKYHYGQLPRQLTSCLAIVDPGHETYWMIDATPDFKEQLYTLQSSYPGYSFGGILLTHAHVGHYTGLIHLGREIIGANEIPVYAMPIMADFLTNNGPWSQLVALKNINLIPIQSDWPMQLNDQLAITPIQVPHRDEYSETVGYKIVGSQASLLFIPDIDKWNKWDRDILTEIQAVDYALLDGTFYENGEIPGRDMALIPHPFIQESLKLFQALNSDDRKKVQFIHFNHTNPVIDYRSDAFQAIINTGMGVAKEGSKMYL